MSWQKIEAQFGAGLTNQELVDGAAEMVRNAYPPGKLELCTSASAFCCNERHSQEHALPTSGSASSLETMDRVAGSTADPARYDSLAEIARIRILPLLETSGLLEEDPSETLFTARALMQHPDEAQVRSFRLLLPTVRACLACDLSLVLTYTEIKGHHL